MKTKADFINSKGRMVCFVSHRLFSKGKYESNVKSLERMAKELYMMGFSPIMPHVLCPWLINDGWESHRTFAIEVCKSVILKCDFIVFNCNKQSKGVQEEISFADKYGIPIYEIHYLRTILKGR